MEQLFASVCIKAHDTASTITARKSWARFIKKIWEVDPLICRECDGVARNVAFIVDPQIIRAILIHLSLWDIPRQRSPPSSTTDIPKDVEYVPCVD